MGDEEPRFASRDILPGLWRVGGGSWGVTESLSSEADCNVYLLVAGDARVLIDCGTLAGRPLIEANLRAVGVSPDNLTDLLLTHSHYDHTQAASVWQDGRSLRTHLSAAGADCLRRGEHRLVGYATVAPDYPFEPFHVDHDLRDGDTCSLGDVTLKVQSLPGHTPDSTLLTFEHAGRRVGVCGDIVFGPIYTGAWGYLGWLDTLWESDVEAYRGSLRRMLEGPPLDLLLPGHGHVLVGQETIRRAVSSALATAEATTTIESRARFTRSGAPDSRPVT
jgi:glyoxylase-like metal-dependent hydrolase (beta-lactamase superfamily II)